uniref:Uncharacterized protein n=1 Tax=Arundo donax TaxID=35708 RepID=A0A0A9B0B8_ARUDO
MQTDASTSDQDFIFQSQDNFRYPWGCRKPSCYRSISCMHNDRHQNKPQGFPVTGRVLQHSFQVQTITGM